jgi:hypothetical protein
MQRGVKLQIQTTHKLGAKDEKSFGYEAGTQVDTSHGKTVSQKSGATVHLIMQQIR